jgi:hypothetical protein
MEEKDELTRQCKMAWNRGFEFGLILGALGMFSINIFFVIIILTK